MKRSVLVSLMLVVGLSCAIASAQSPDLVKKNDLKNHPFQVGDLGLTIGTFRPHLRDLPTFVRTPGQIQVRAVNSTDRAVQYSPMDIVLVGSDGKQVNLRGRFQMGFFDPDSDRLDPIQAMTIAPGAILEEFYELTGPVKLPARLYYGGQQLAVITN